MRNKSLWLVISMLIVLSLIITACQPAPAQETTAPEETQATVEETTAPETEEFVFGILMVGPYNDHGWSQAHYEAGLYVEENIPGTRMVYIDKVNPADRPGTTASQLGEELMAQGAELVIFNSDDMKDEASKFAEAHPDVFVIMASGDTAWEEGKAFDPKENLTNIMGRMEYGKMMAGCAAALTTQTGKIGYLGPLINDETRRLAASAFLGAQHCWEEYRDSDPADLEFKVTWIGFWFNIPGVTSDPTLVADDFFNTGYDVVISGIDTTEGLQEAKKMADGGMDVWAIPYDFIGACEEGSSVCLGVPYFNWGPMYVQHIQTAIDGTWQATFQWEAPGWSDLNNLDTTAVGFVKGDALSEEAAADLDAFIADLAGGLNLWTGPINLQDETPYLAEGEVATDQQVWYLPQLLEGMEGQSVLEE